MNKNSVKKIEVSVQPFYVEAQSAPEESLYVFAYTVRIRNTSMIAARLVSRHWIITNADGKVQEVRGAGVVGEQPYLRPGEAFQYTSSAVLDTAVGTMRGHYRMVTDEGAEFDAEIPVFILSVPRTLH